MDYVKKHKTEHEILPDKAVIEINIPEFNSIIVTPVCDLHYGSPAFIEDLWAAHKKKILTTPNMFCVLGGDLMNNGTSTSKTGSYTDTVPPSKQKNWLCRELEPLAEAGKILCGVPGNHEKRTSKDSDGKMLWDVFEILQMPELYRNSRAYLNINVGITNKQRKSGKAYLGLIEHGTFGGKTAGAGLDKLVKFTKEFEGLDFVIVGHSHKGTVDKVVKTVINPFANKITTRQVTVVMATSYLDLEDYVADMNLTLASTDQEYLHFTNSSNGKAKDIEFRW